MKPIRYLLALFALITATAITANAQQFPPRFGNFDNVPALVTTDATSNVVSSAVTLFPGRGLAVMPHFAGTNTATTNVIFDFEVTYDGTNWSTVTAVTLTNALNGTTAVRGYHAIPPDTLDNVKAIRLQSIENRHSASVFITNVTWSVFPRSQ